MSPKWSSGGLFRRWQMPGRFFSEYFKRYPFKRDENVWNVFIFLNLPLVHTSVSGVERNNSSDSGCHSDKDDGVTTSQAAMGALKLQTSKLNVGNRIGIRLGLSNFRVSRWLGF